MTRQNRQRQDEARRPITPRPPKVSAVDARQMEELRRRQVEPDYWKEPHAKR